MPKREREELEAAIEARRELGEEFEPQVIDSFLERIESRIDARATEIEKHRRPGVRHPDWSAFVLAICTVGIGVPIVETASFAGEIAM